MKRFNNNIQFVIGVGFIFCLFFLLPNHALASEISVESVFKEINIERQNQQIPELVLNNVLTHIAEIRANDMINNDYFDHKDPNGLMPWDYAIRENYNYQIIGENLALDWVQTEEAINAWMNSNAHRDNILNNKFNETGIAIISNNSHTIVVQLFGLQQLSPTTILPAVRANNINNDITPNIDEDSIKNEQTVLTIITKNEESENKQVLGTTYRHNLTPESNNLNISQYFLILAIISFLPLSLSLLLLRPENSKK
ncbi:MAG: CAP domain-containing protein [Candidatus Kerfeldbacteria bacterium]|jgi:cysteine-rich secretory family protein